MRSLPDEIGAIAFAAKLVGYDWNYVLTHPEMYYGSGTIFFTYPLFCIVKDPLILYQCLLGVGAFLHALTAFIAGEILTKYYKEEFSSISIIIISAICAFITPTRTSNIDNEPMLVLICWIIVYLIMRLQHSVTKTQKILFSILLGFILGFAYLSHTRAIMYAIVIFAIFILYYLMTHKILVNIFFFLVSLSGSYFSFGIIVEHIRGKIFTNHEISGGIVSNSPVALINSVTNGGNSLLSPEGVKGFFDLLMGNIWIMYIFSGGLISLVIYAAIKITCQLIIHKLKNNKCADSTDIYFPFMYCILGLTATLIGLCITWIEDGIKVNTLQSNLSRGHFYLRYYGNFIAPLFLFLFIFIRQQKLSVSQKSVYRILVVIVFIFDYCLLGFVCTALKSYTKHVDWFYYFAPFSLKFEKWPDCTQNIFYFLISTIVVTIIFLILSYLSNKNIERMTIVLLFFVIWEYGYGVFMFDRPYAMSDNYYLAANSLYELNKADNSVLENCDTVFYYNKAHGPGYIVQFIIPDKKVITDLTLIKTSEDNVIISSEILNNEIIDDTYSYAKLDDNEYLYTNNEKRKNKLAQLGYLVNEIN